MLYMRHTDLPMPIALPLADRIARKLGALSAAERRVASVFEQNPEEVLLASAQKLAGLAKTSDATVLRTMKALGYSGMEDLRRSIAVEFRSPATPASRMAETLAEVGRDLEAALKITLSGHLAAIDKLQSTLPVSHFTKSVKLLSNAGRTVLFGLGPSSALVNYLAIQLRRLGLQSMSLTNSGLLFADDLNALRTGDAVLILAYSHAYPELTALLNEANRLKLRIILITDTLGQEIGRRVDVVLPVARGRTNMLSMHTATLALLEALLVGIAAARPEASVQNLKTLNRLRSEITGKSMNLPVKGR